MRRNLIRTTPMAKPAPGQTRANIRSKAEVLANIASRAEQLGAWIEAELGATDFYGERLGPPPYALPLVVLALVLTLRLRQPVLPLRRAGGRIDWVDAEGRILPGELAGPEGEPRIHGVEDAPPEALAEVLALWPRLKAAMQELAASGRFRSEGSGIDRILLHEPLSSRSGRSERGIVFVLAGPSGTRLVWGRPGEAAYGMSPERKLANFVHTLTCQGSRPEDLHRVQDINVRFPEPFAVVAR